MRKSKSPAIPERQRQAGQAIIWLLATFAASAAVLYAVFNFSQVTVGKQRAVNAADAAALAGATAQARLLNLMAYTNRGIVANEVFLIQMLSMESWLQYMKRTSGNISMALNFIPPLQPLARALGQASDAAGRGRDLLKDKVNPGIITVLEGTKEILLGSQVIIHGGGGLLAEDAAKSIVMANRTDFGGRMDAGVVLANSGAVRALTFGLNEKDWLNFTKSYGGGERRDGKQILLASRDAFSASRPGTSLMNIDLVISGLAKNGGSELKGFDRWETQDTLEVWTKVPCKRGFCKEYMPVGWGRSNASPNANKGDTWAPNRAAQQLARSEGGTHEKWKGVPTLYDIKDKTLASREALGLDFRVAVARPAANDFSTTSLGMGAEVASPLGSAHMPARQAAQQNTAFAKARVFFERPRRGLLNDFTASNLWRPDSAKEYGSLYSPFWQARLRDLSVDEKAKMVAVMGISIDKAIYTPGGQ